MRIKEPIITVIRQVNDIPEYAVYRRHVKEEKVGKKTVMVETEECVIKPMAINTMLAHYHRWLVYNIFNYDNVQVSDEPKAAV